MRGLHAEYADRDGVARAVDGVDLVLGSGEIVALVGESGCGKTTLARTIMGLKEPSEGEVLFRGEPLRFDRAALREHRRHAQMVFQDPTGALNARQTIYEAVAEGVRIQKIEGDEEQMVADALGRAGLRPPESFFTRYPYEVSGGQRQRVIIAGAMVLSPSLLVADEPVSALDASVRGEILALLLELVRETGLSALVVTHDLGLAWNVADRVAVMYLGRIVEEGPAEEVLTDPKHPYTRALLSVVPETRQMEQQILTGETPDPTRIPSGCRFHPRCPRARVRRGRPDRDRGQVPRGRPALPSGLPRRPLASRHEHEAYVHERRSGRRDRRGIRGGAGGGAGTGRRSVAAPRGRRAASPRATCSSAATRRARTSWRRARTRRGRSWWRARSRPPEPRRRAGPPPGTRSAAGCCGRWRTGSASGTWSCRRSRASRPASRAPRRSSRCRRRST